MHLRDRIGAYRLYLILSGSSATFLWFAFGVNLVFQVERVGLNPLQIILVGTVLEATCLLFEIPTGRLGDRYGSRAVLTRIVVWWSAFTALTGAASGLVSLVAIRFLFGAADRVRDMEQIASDSLPRTRRMTPIGELMARIVARATP